jgi:predicted HTH domain antitoxin
MHLNIPDHLLTESGLSESDLRLEIALLFYQRRSLSLGKAAEWAGISRFAFQKEMGKRQIPINYGVAEFEEDMDTLGL